MKDTILTVVIVPTAIVVIGFFFYGLFGFLSFLMSDPFDWIDDVTIPSQSEWNLCVQDAKYIFDNFNDTVGATYALEDRPSTEVQNFMKQCLEERANLSTK